jgi:hypothetical protein
MPAQSQRLMENHDIVAQIKLYPMANKPVQSGRPQRWALQQMDGTMSAVAVDWWPLGETRYCPIGELSNVSNKRLPNSESPEIRRLDCMSEDIFESTAKGKALFFGVTILAAFYVFVGADWLANILHPDTSNLTFEEIEELIRRNNNLVVIFSPIAFVFHSLLGYQVFSLGRKIEKSGQSPPPGSNIPFSMKIKRGKSALNQARGYYFGAVLMVINGLIPLIYAIILQVK